MCVFGENLDTEMKLGDNLEPAKYTVEFSSMIDVFTERASQPD